MTEIAVLVPVLGRPDNAAPVARSWAASDPARVTDLFFVVSLEDTAQVAACLAARNEVGPDRVRILDLTDPPGPGDFARKINFAARSTATYPFVFQGADDLHFEPGWAEAALTVAEQRGVSVVGTNDLGNPTVMRGDHSTHTLIRRTYIQDPGGAWAEPGNVFHEAYGHQWCDTELIDLAKARGEWAFAPDALVRHNHPFWNRAVPLDDTYRRGQATGAADQRLYLARRRLWRAR